MTPAEYRTALAALGGNLDLGRRFGAVTGRGRAPMMGETNMAKQVTKIETPAELTLVRATFQQRMEEIKAAHAQRHYDAALGARLDFDDRLVRMVRDRAVQVLEAVVGD
jgi:hypothetical protein